MTDAMDNQNLSAALALRDHGIAIFPVDPEKKPRPGVRWRDDATTDAARIWSWWRRWPDSMPAFEPGRHGLLAVDCDRKPGRPDGVAGFEMLAVAHSADPREWPTIETPSGGRHVFFAQGDRGLTNRRGSLPAGIDIRGSGGYVVAEGSIRPDGTDYHALPGCDGLLTAIDAQAMPDLPDWLLELLERSKEGEEDAPIDAAKVIKLIQKDRNVQLAGQDRLRISVKTNTPAERAQAAKVALQAIRAT
jgi:hypothetical protein